MMKNTLLSVVTVICLLTAETAFAEMNKEELQRHFKSGVINAQAALRQQNKSRIPATAFNQLFICNNTNLPSQSGTTVQISFPQTGTADQFPPPGSCAYLTNDYGGFITQTLIYAPANSGYLVYNNNISSGQMWSVTYDADKNTYPATQIQ